MVAAAEQIEEDVSSEFAVGTRAIVSTGQFRCLAIFEEDQQWHDVYGPGEALNVVRVIDPFGRAH